MKRNKNIALNRLDTVRLFILIAFLLVVIFANAQTDITVTAQGDAERSVPFTERLKVLPKVVDTSFNAYPVTYKLIPVSVLLNLQPVTIAPVQLTVLEPLEKLYRGYAKAGIGNFLNAYGDVYYASTRSKQSAWDINLKHHSSQGGLKDLGFNGFSDNHAKFSYQYFKYRYSIEADGAYEYNALNYYGFNPANFTDNQNKTVLSRDANFQRFTVAKASLKYQTHYKDSLKVNTNLSASYRFMDDVTHITEHNALITGESMKLMDKELYYMNYSLDYNYFLHPVFYNGISRNIDTRALNENAILNINPNIRTQGDNWSVRVGFAVMANITNTAKFFFYPDAEADYRLFNDILIPYVGIKGNLQRNSFYTFTQENPFLSSDVTLKNTNKLYDFYGGLRGSISSKVSFNLSAGVAKYRDYALFVNDTVSFVNNAFNIIYDTVTLSTFSAQTTYVNNEKLKVYLRGDYYLYSTVHQEQAWNRPNYKVSLSSVYDLADKIMVRGEVFVAGDRYFLITKAQEGIVDNRLKPFVDFNLGFEYRYTQRLSAFINFNNIISKKYQYWNSFPVQGINLLGGVTYRF